MATGIFKTALLGLIANIPVDAKLAEQHTFNAVPTNFAIENGSVFSDHIVLQPEELEIPYILNNNDFIASYGIKAATLMTLLYLNMQRRELYTIVTHHRLYLSMAFVGLSNVNQAPNTGEIQGVAKFQQMNLPNLTNIVVKISDLAKDGTGFKAATKTNLGLQTLKDVSSTPGLFDSITNLFGT